MKKLILFVALIATVLFTSCTTTGDNSDTNKTQVEWNLEASAQGEGLFVLAYPTGNLRLEGTASATACSASQLDSLLKAVPNGAPEYRDVLANPSNYSDEEVMLANEVKSAIYIDTLQGTWKASVVGYVKYDRFYVVVDEHWPKDSTDNQ